jgi:hypothetical protein
MDLEALPRRRLASESVDRRVLGAFILVDAATRLPVVTPATVQARRATVAGLAQPIALPPHAVRILRNRRGIFVIQSAPFFDAYTTEFLEPQDPVETAGGPLGLQIAVLDAGPFYLPQEFRLDLPRSIDPAMAGSVFEPQAVALFRSPAAPMFDGWGVLRVQVTQTDSDPAVRLPGVLVRVFQSPRAAADPPLGAGMTDWRGPARGEAMVPLPALQRFRPGAAANVVETTYDLSFEATRDPAFTANAAQLPDVPRLLAGTGFTRVVSEPPDPPLHVTRPTPPVIVQAGQEYVVHLTMP